MSDTLNAKVPYDLQIENEQLNDRRALVQALMQKALSPNVGQMVGPHYAAPNVLGSIGAPIMQALMAQRMRGQNQEQARELAGRYKDVQGRMTPKEILSVPGASLESRRQAATAGDVNLLAPDQREHVVNGQVVTTTPGQGAKPVGDFRDRFGPVGPVATGPDGTPIIGQTEKTTGQAKFAPKGVSVSVNTAQKAGDKFATELAGKRADIIGKSYDNAIAASKAYEAMYEARKDLEAGIKSGATANVNLVLGKVGRALGMTDDPSIVSTEAYRSNMARETLNLVKNLGAGTGISNADREFAEKAAGGDITLDDRTMYRLLNVAAAASGNVLVEHQRLLESNGDASGALPQDLETFRVPWAITVGSGKTPGGLSFDEKLKKFGTHQLDAPAQSQTPIPLSEYLSSRRKPNAGR